MTVIDFPNTTDDKAPEFSEEALALEFAKCHGNQIRYVDKWKTWFIFDGACWHMDEKREVFSLARKLCREAANTPPD
jgi:putative DNA primase/helicase